MWKMWGIILNDWLIVQLLSIADILQSAPHLFYIFIVIYGGTQIIPSFTIKFLGWII